MKPRVCLFTDSLEPSGVGEHMLTLAAELLDQYHVMFVCPSTTAGLSFLKRASNIGLETAVPEGCILQMGRQQLAHWLQAQDIAVFHGHAGIGWEGHEGVFAARDACIPFIVRTEHLPDLITDPGQSDQHWRTVQVVDRLVCVSEAARASFLRAGVPAAKLRVVRNGIRAPRTSSERPSLRARRSLPPDARVVLTVARFTEQKGHRYLAQAVPVVLQGEPRAHFLWVGEGPLTDELRCTVRALGVEAHVSFLGPRDDVPELLIASELFVLPSLFEGLPLAVLEAMAVGLPVIGTRVCGMTEAVHDGVTGRLVAPRDAAALADAILHVLAQPSLMTRWGSAGRLRVEREFSAARMASEIIAVYQEGASRHAATTVVAGPPRDSANSDGSRRGGDTTWEGA